MGSSVIKGMTVDKKKWCVTGQLRAVVYMCLNRVGHVASQRGS